MDAIAHPQPGRADDYSEQISFKLERMNNHPVFAMMTDIRKLQIFMQWHVFAVWDFMALVKRLQWQFTCETVPWLPPQNPRAARLINEIVLGEETDEAPGGAHASHFELYLSAMKEIGASTRQIDRFIEHVRSGQEVEAALLSVAAPAPIAQFVRTTVDLARHAPTSEVLGSFFYGREHSIPRMFQSLLDNWTVDPRAAPTFVYYLQRHIQLDTEAHGPAVEGIIAEVMDDLEESRAAFFQSALKAIDLRIALWDGLALALEALDPRSPRATQRSSPAGRFL
jgi:hypothetical protein